MPTATKRAGARLPSAKMPRNNAATAKTRKVTEDVRAALLAAIRFDDSNRQSSIVNRQLQ